MESSTKTTLDSFFVDNFKHAQYLVNVFRLWVLTLVVSNLASALEVLCKIGLIECIIFLLLLNSACDSLVPCIFTNIVFFAQELCKIHRVTIWPELLQDLFKLGLVLIFAQVGMNAHLSLHLIVVGGHEVAHLVHHVVLALCLNRLLVVAQLPRKQVRLLVLELLSLLLSLLIVFEAHDLVHVAAASIVDFLSVHEPHIVAVVPDKLSLHLKDLDLTDLLEVVADLEALYMGVAFKFTLLEQLVFVNDAEILIVDLLSGCFIACSIQRRLEFHCDGVGLRVLVR